MAMDRRIGILGSAGLGAGLMFFLDPNMGGRRRAILRDKAISLAQDAAWAMDKTARDTRNRLYGTVASARSRFSGEPIADEVLIERVRSRIGRAVSHPSAIEVSAENGKVTLRGPVLSEEMNSLVRTASHVKGVREINNQLHAHDQAGDVPALQGGRSRSGYRFILLQSNWPPAIRLMTLTSGVTATAAGLRQGGVIGTILGGAGTALTVLALTNRNLRQIVNRAATRAGKRMPGRPREKAA